MSTQNKVLWIIQDCSDKSVGLADEVLRQNHIPLLAEPTPCDSKGFYLRDYDPNLLYATGSYFDFNSKFLELQKLPVVIHGSLQFSQQVHSRLSVHPGIFACYRDYDFSTYSSYIYNYLLNKDYILLPSINFEYRITDLSHIFKSKYLFIKSDRSDKSFCGSSIYLGNSKEIDFSKSNVNLVVSSCKNIDSEYRVLIVDRIPVVSSIYKQKNDTREKQELLDYCKLVLEKLPEKYNTFTMDICVYKNSLSVVELNSFSAAGLYDCDLETVVKEISKKAIKEYESIF